ncbi:MAG: hypothetical protein J3Q66DRAFT_399460 [Benniella sp.]|nr:MAG: hypothetical protein J3Q66DRAFT_399460 [Benniella sp.]
MIIATSGIRARAALGAMPLRSGAYHWSNRGGKSFPFSTQNKTMLGIKVAAFCGLPFAAAFLPGHWQNIKAGRA